jgi:toxin FitB
MNYLVDTCVASEPTQARPNPRVLRWLHENGERTFYSVVTMAEIRFGIERKPDSAKKQELERWFELLHAAAEPFLLPVDERVALAWKQLLARLKPAGVAVSCEDSLIAATEHDAPTGLPVLGTAEL